jgi:NAD+--asparagine ADP-ribosyltransferase
MDGIGKGGIMIEALAKAAESGLSKEALEKTSGELPPSGFPDEISGKPEPDFKPPWEDDSPAEIKQSKLPDEISGKPGPDFKPPWENKDIPVNTEKIDYPSTYKERIKKTPTENSDRGEWTGKRGESKYIPSDEEIKTELAKHGLDGIEYRNGIPDFSEVAEATVEIENMSDDRDSNFKQCDQKCAEQWSEEGKDGKTDWTARDVRNWRRDNGYSWHERNDMKTCDLILPKINVYFGHLGGVAECKKAKSRGGGFDE